MSSVLLDKNELQDTRYIYNHDIMNCTADGVIANHLFSGRALGITEPWDMIQLHPALQPMWDCISAHYDRVGLSHSKQVIWNLDLKELGAHIGLHPSVFFYGPDECQYWGDGEWLKAVDFINSKNNFMRLAEELNIDVPRTLCFDHVDDISISDLTDMAYPCYLKAAISVSGVGIYRCENEKELLHAVTKFDSATPVQIQEEVIASAFLNMQYKVVGNEAIRLAASEQILDGFVHQGNRVPASHEPWHVIDPMAEWLVSKGMKGIFAFDVAIVQTDSGLRFPAIECNPRFNGASYPTLVAQKLGIDEWSSLSLSTQFRSMKQIDLSGIEYNLDTGEGVIVINWGTILEGKLMVLLAGPPEYQQVVEVELKQRL